MALKRKIKERKLINRKKKNRGQYRTIITSRYMLPMYVDFKK